VCVCVAWSAVLALQRKFFSPPPVNTADLVASVMQLNQKAEILTVTYLTGVAVKRRLALDRPNICWLPNVVEILKEKLKINSISVTY